MNYKYFKGGRQKEVGAPGAKNPRYASATMGLLMSTLLTFTDMCCLATALITETSWANFKSIIWPIIDLFVPKKRISHNNKHNVRKYLEPIHNLLNREAATWLMLKNHKTPELQTKNIQKFQLNVKQLFSSTTLNLKKRC